MLPPADASKFGRGVPSQPGFKTDIWGFLKPKQKPPRDVVQTMAGPIALAKDTRTNPDAQAQSSCEFLNVQYAGTGPFQPIARQRYYK